MNAETIVCVPDQSLPMGRTEAAVFPDAWEVQLLASLAEIRSGIAMNSKKAVSDSVVVHYLRVANVQDGYLDLSEMNTIRVSRDDLRKYAVLPGDVLMNEGGDLDKLGRGAVWNGEFHPCIHQNHVFVVRCTPRISPRYLDYWTQSSGARRYFALAGKQTTNLASINKTALGHLPVAVPSVPEQRAIAEALSDVDGLLGAQEALIAKKRAIKQAAMQQLLTGKTRLPGFSGEWETRRIGEIAPLQRGFDLPTAQLEVGRLPVVYSNGVLNHHSMSMVRAPGVVTGRSGTIGKVHYIEEDFWPHNTALWVTSFRGNEPKFIYYLYTYLDFSRLLSGSGVPTLNRNDVHQYEVRCPDPNEQAAVATVLSDMDAEIAALEARRDKTRVIKQGMMQQLLTGRVRLVEPAASEIGA